MELEIAVSDFGGNSKAVQRDKDQRHESFCGGPTSYVRQKRRTASLCRYWKTALFLMGASQLTIMTVVSWRLVMTGALVNDGKPQQQQTNHYYVLFFPQLPFTARNLRYGSAGYDELSVYVHTVRKTSTPRVVGMQTGFFDHISENRVRPWRRSIEFELPSNLESGNPVEDDRTRRYSITDSSDLPHLERRKFPHHERDEHCIPTAAWQYQSFPTCNEMHSTDIRESLTAASTDRMSLLSNQGSWRLAWRHEQYEQSHATNTSAVVWKTFRYEKPMEEAFFELNRVDALAMERLTKSPYVINVYAYCGLSVVSEYAGKTLDTIANQMTSSDRLQVARQVAQGLSDVHSLDDSPSLVHNDINTANLVFTQDDRPLLNDFNVAILLMKHNETGASCPYRMRFPNPQWKSPEEQVLLSRNRSYRPFVTEKTDIYALGNVLYRLAVGQSPWKRNSLRITAEEKERIAHAKFYNGTLPVVPYHVETSSDASIQLILGAMRLCYSFHPEDRPSAQELVHFLSEEIEKQQ